MERLEKNLDFENNRFLFLFGGGVQDCFMSDDFQEIGILESLWRILIKKGFECVLFFSHQERVFFFDERSRTHCRLPRGAGLEPRNGIRKEETNRFFSGPLGKRMLLAPNSTNATSEQHITEPDPKNSRISRIPDQHVLEIMDWLMQDENTRTAIVISQAETTMHYFSIMGAQAGRMGAWAALPIRNRNLCIFLFADSDLPTRNEEHWESTIPVPEIADYFKASRENRKCQAILKIPGPDKNEVKRILDYIRLMRKKKIKWNERDRLVQILFGDGKKGRQYMQILPKAPSLDINSITPYLDSSRNKTTTWREELDHLEGLDEIKQKILRLESYYKDRKAREEGGVISIFDQPPSLHFLFKGNPGTGKTTVAGFLGEMYRDLGLLLKGHMIYAVYSDLVGNVVGDSVKKTNTLIDKALDGVLFVDEAYQLSEKERGGFGQEAIDCILTRMENDRSRLVVVFAGYTNRMDDFLKANPGLGSRVYKDNIIEFPDYLPDELFNIFKKFIQAKGLEGTEAFYECVKEIIQNLYKERDRETFGNARKMREFADSTEFEHATRISTGKNLDTRLTPEDISQEFRRFQQPEIPDLNVLMEELNRLIGLNEIKDLIKDLVTEQNTKKIRQKKGQGVIYQPLNFIFSGNPGTGKTTVARLLGKIFCSIGVLRKGHVKEIRAGDLTAGYSGQTTGMARKTISDALDGILFIDEAYNLIPGSDQDTYKKEAIDVLMDFIDNQSNRLIVILAGYPREMQKLIQSNPGLSRRFTRKMEFPDYSDDELEKILISKSQYYDIKVSSKVCKRARQYFQRIRTILGSAFGNASVVEELLNRMLKNQSRRYEISKDEKVLEEFVPEDVPDFESNQDAPVTNGHLHCDLVSLLPKMPSSVSLQDASKCVGLLEVGTKHGIGSGSGFIVTPQGHVITAYHVIEGAERIKFLRESSNEELTAEVIGFDEETDLAILRLPIGSNYPWLSLAEVDFEPKRGLELVVLGYPLASQFGNEITQTEGSISSLREEGSILQISAPVTHGSSGGPVLRKSDLHVIGVIHGGAKEPGASMNFARSVKSIFSKFTENLER